VQMNLRLVKAFGFGKRIRPGGADAAGGGAGAGGPRGGGGGPRGGGGGGPRGGGGGRGGGSISSGHKYNFNAGVQVQNLFNYVPYTTPNASLSSPLLFGRSQSLIGGQGNSGSAVRTVTLQLNFNF